MTCKERLVQNSAFYELLIDIGTTAGTLVSQQFAQPGITYLSAGAQFQRPGTVTADMLSGLTSGQVGK